MLSKIREFANLMHFYNNYNRNIKTWLELFRKCSIVAKISIYSFKPVCRIRNVLMQIPIQILLNYSRDRKQIFLQNLQLFFPKSYKIIMCKLPRNDCPIDDGGEGVRDEE